ncbi:MAG: integrase [Nitrososphaera sp.]
MPTDYANILRFDVLTGLRPTEALMSVGLVRKGGDYYNRERRMLEHFKYPDLFLRRTKKCYISLVDAATLDIAKAAGEYSYMGLQSMLVRHGVPSHTKFCRKLFATHLRMKGIEPELIDLLQGRVPRSVFGRHYFRPDFDAERPRIEKAIASLAKEIL